jgi:hypothetical protein
LKKSVCSFLCCGGNFGRVGVCIGGALLCILTFGCSSGTECTSELKPALLVDVVYASGAEACDVVVSARAAGGASEELSPIGDCRFSGGKQAGTYKIVVSRASEQLAVSQAVVESDECGTKTALVTITVPNR